MTSFCLHGIILSRKAELDQFVSGLGPLVDVIKQHPKKMEPLLVAGIIDNQKIGLETQAKGPMLLTRHP